MGNSSSSRPTAACCLPGFRLRVSDETHRKSHDMKNENQQQRGRTMHSIYCEATLCTYLPTCLPACLPIYLSIESSFDPFIQPANQPTIYVCVSISLYIYLFIIYICVYTHQMISYAYVCSILCKWFFLQDIHVFSLQCKFTLFSSHNTWLHMFFVCAPFNRAAKQHVKRSM